MADPASKEYTNVRCSCAHQQSERRDELDVAVRTIETLIDPQNAPTTERLEVVLHALKKLDALMGNVRTGTWLQPRASATHSADICALVANEAIGMQAYARAARGIVRL
jgi:hypothetical protein